MKNVAIVRDRGQLTIPESMRKKANWISPMSAVTISFAKPNEIVIKPLIKTIDKKRIWENVKKARAIKGLGSTMSTAEFLELDRKSH